VPATGPYVIDQCVEGEQLVLVRNPQFHEWYAPAQPQGYPDRIVVTLGLSLSEQIAEVERGRADWLTDWYSLTSGDIETLVTQYAGQVHTYPLKWTYWVALNSSMPPFNDPRARKAVNYALDRSKVVDEFGGPQSARATCQFLPPNLPGYRPYCPYTLEPNPAGQWTAPDLDRAKELIRTSGTKRRHGGTLSPQARRHSRVGGALPRRFASGLGLPGAVRFVIGRAVFCRARFQRSIPGRDHWLDIGLPGGLRLLPWSTHVRVRIPIPPRSATPAWTRSSGGPSG
jgi:peptide/nickel transport system substrate-binding protein